MTIVEGECSMAIRGRYKGRGSGNHNPENRSGIESYEVSLDQVC